MITSPQTMPARQNSEPGRWFRLTTRIGALAIGVFALTGVVGSHTAGLAQAAAIHKAQMAKFHASEGYWQRSGVFTGYNILY